MGFFPYMAPLTPWIKQVMEEREANPQLSILQKNPFAILTSAALVVEGGTDVYESNSEKRKTAIQQIIANIPSNAYKGCIIASNINNTELSYSLGETPVGIDFTGKVITAKNETGRRVSTPIIESIDIDTDGANNTLKVAKVSVRCFTLKQLEMFELFFMKPGMFLLLEYGDATLKFNNDRYPRVLKPGEPVTNKTTEYKSYQDGTIEPLTPYASIQDALVQKTDYSKFCKEDFFKYFRSDRTGQIDYIKRVEKSLGTYDLVAGKVTDYNFSVDKDGTYQCSIDISQGNQITMATAHSTPSKKSGTQVQPKNLEFTPYDQILELMAADLNITKDNLITLLGDNDLKPDPNYDWSLDFFNFVKVNKEQQDTTASSDAYVSLRFILRILMNYILAEPNCDKRTFILTLADYTKFGTTEKVEIIPVQSHKNIMSSNAEILYPRSNMPLIKAETKSKKGDKEKKTDEVNQEIFIENPQPKIDGRIGKKLDFHFDTDIERKCDQQTIQIKKDLGDDLVLGNALNIFVKYETVVKFWKSTYTRLDFLEKVLGVVNQNSYGFFNLVFGVSEERGPSTVFDYRFAPTFVQEQSEAESYRFKPTTINSIIKDFSFNFEMSNLVAGRTVFNSGKFLALAKSAAAASGSQSSGKNSNGEDVENITKLDLPPQAYKQVDNSTFGNADGWYSINNVELERILDNFKKAKEAEQKKSTVSTEENKKPETTKPADNLSDVVKTKSVNFLIDEDSPKGRKVVLIYKDPNFIRNQMLPKKEKDLNKPTVSPITVTITLDGFSGFRCGQYFNIDGIPEIYNKIGVFQITNTKHNISKEGWTTTVEADHRILTQIKKT